MGRRIGLATGIPTVSVVSGGGWVVSMGPESGLFNLSRKKKFHEFSVHRNASRGGWLCDEGLPYHPLVGKSALIGKPMPDLDKRAQAGRCSLFRIVALGPRLVCALCFPPL
jgi:hypothetical protein